MTTTATQADTQPQSAAAPSPFPPIADYAFLSDCHTGALVAPDGAVDWLCVPSFDAPSIFGSVLDREAGMFRLAPFAINHPTARSYEPGTNVLVTVWKTPSGWIVKMFCSPPSLASAGDWNAIRVPSGDQSGSFAFSSHGVIWLGSVPSRSSATERCRRSPRSSFGTILPRSKPA